MYSVLAICMGACMGAGIGACAGALTRWGLGLWLNPLAAIPLGTLAANLIRGCLIGICIAAFEALPQLGEVWRLTLVTGFLGALTTFSTFTLEVVTMLQQARYLLAMGTSALHLLGSLAMTLLGIHSAKIITRLL